MAIQDDIANILSLHCVVAKWHVEYNSRVDNTFIIWKKDKSARWLTPTPSGLFYCNTQLVEGTILSGDVSDSIMDPEKINNIKTNMTRITKRQIKDLKAARYIQNTT